MANLSQTGQAGTKILFKNIRELVTMKPMTQSGYSVCKSHEDLGIMENAWMLIDGSKVQATGSGSVPDEILSDPSVTTIDTRGSLVMPGLVDSHTHPVFAGNRSQEFAMRLNGLSYQEIAAQGGGIRSSMTNTRKADSESLANAITAHLNQFMSWGVTTAEVKTGYGLSVDEELRQLSIIKQLKSRSQVHMVTTLLALHALPPEFSTYQDYVSHISDQLLPVVAREQLAEFTDVFIENGYFQVDHCEQYMEKARDLGLGIRVHADEFSDAGGASAAARWGAASADHLQFASDSGLKAMAEARVTATILPGTSLYTAIPFSNGRRMADAGCAVAIASDFNPGSCYISNLPMLAALAGLHGKLKTWEVIAAITYIPARSLNIGHRKGALAKGYDSDFLIHPAGDHYAWLADMGQTRPTEVWSGGIRLERTE